MNHLAVNRHKITYWLIWCDWSANQWTTESVNHRLSPYLVCMLTNWDEDDRVNLVKTVTVLETDQHPWHWQTNLTQKNAAVLTTLLHLQSLFFFKSSVWFQNGLLIIMPQCVPHIQFSCSFSKFCIKSFAGVWYFDIVCDLKKKNCTCDNK